MIRLKLIFAGFGRHGIEALIAVLVLAAAATVVAASAMVVEGARTALLRVESEARPDIVQVKGRFNRALFDTPRSGYLPPLTLPVYEPLIDPQALADAAGRATVLGRQSLLRNVVSGDRFLNVYIFGIEPDQERQVSSFFLRRGRFLRRDDQDVAVMDEGSARALGVDLNDAFLVRKADGEDLRLTVVGVLGGLELRHPPLSTIETPELRPPSPFVSSGIFVTQRASQEMFARQTLTDALVVADSPSQVPALVQRIRERFRLNPGIFVEESYTQFRRQVRDFELTLTLFATMGSLSALIAGAFVAKLLHDPYEDRRRQYPTLPPLRFSPLRIHR